MRTITINSEKIKITKRGLKEGFEDDQRYGPEGNGQDLPLCTKIIRRVIYEEKICKTNGFTKQDIIDYAYLNCEHFFD